MNTAENSGRRRITRWERRRRLPLRVRLALWSAALVFVLSFALLLFINSVAISTFPRIVRANTTPPVTVVRRRAVDPHYLFPPFLVRSLFPRPLNPVEESLLFELQSISLIGLGMVALLGGAGAYWLAGIALRPVRNVSQAAQQIGADTLDTRLALVGPKDEVKELADTFDGMLERLQHTFELQGRFVADVAHELRTPLASLRTNLEVVAADEQATLDDYRAMSATQERALTRLERLVADLLILTTSEQPLTPQDVSPGSLVEETLADLQPLAAAQGVSLQSINEADIVVRGDGSLLARAFSNLVENAIRYNHAGGSVTVTISSKDGWAVIAVKDTGAGIAPENQPRIFERFYRVDTSRSRHRGGAGLGLSIVSAIVQQHGGNVQIESKPGEGSIFTVLLPQITACQS